MIQTPDPNGTSLASPATSQPPADLPPWATEMRRKYEADECNLFLLYGNVLDLFPFRAEFLRLREFLTRALSGGKKMVLYYNISEGISFATPEMKQDFGRFLTVFQSLGFRVPGCNDVAAFSEHTELLRDPGTVLPLLERLVETQNNVFIVMDYVDKVIPATDTAFMSLDDRRNLTALQRWAVDPRLLPRKGRDNVVILVSTNLGDVHRDLRSNPLMDTVEIKFPDIHEREEFIQQAGVDLSVPLQMPPEQLAHLTAGLNRISLSNFFQQARKTGCGVDLGMVKRRKDEIFREEYGGLVEVIEPDYGLEMVAGLEEVKEDLKLVIDLLRGGDRKECPMGVGLVGPPGTGKTMIGKAVAKGAGLPFLKIGDIRDKFVGESEKNADRVLTLLRSLAPVVVFVDEIDQAYGGRGERGDEGVSQRIWAKFAEIQSDTAYRGLILWIWATNRPDIMDEATKRPGRLGDLKIPFFFAASDPERVLAISAKKNGVPLKAKDLGAVALRLKGYSAAELEAVTLQSRWWARRAGHKQVTEADLVKAAEDYIPSRNDKMIQFMEILAILEASSLRMLPASYRNNYDRSALVETVHRLRGELTASGML
ncbi:MAG TPA: ATP-binding protein [Armatimonadota bacterium]